MWARGVPARRMQHQLDVIGRRSDGPWPQPDLAHFKLGVAVQGKELADAPGDTGSDRIHRSAGHHLFGGLEHQPHSDRQIVHRGERLADAQEDGGVPVVTAGVRHTLDRGGEGLPGPFGDGKGVHVSTEPHQRPCRPEIAHQAGSLGQDARREACVGQFVEHHPSGPQFTPGQFGVGVEVTTPRHQLRTVLRQPAVQLLEETFRIHSLPTHVEYTLIIDCPRSAICS